MAISIYRRKMIEKLAALGGMHCAYCRQPVHIPLDASGHIPNAATLDHIIPKAKGGTNAFENYALACARCNHMKADRDLAEFLANPHAHKKPTSKRGKAKAAAKKRPVYKFLPDSKAGQQERSAPAGTLAHAIQKGEIDPERLTYRSAPVRTIAYARVMNPVPLAMTQRILKEGGAAKRDIAAVRAIEWPWLRELVKPLVSQVGFGPWKDS